MPLSDGERKQIRQLIEDAGGDANPSGWFEPLYHQAHGDAGEIPWAHMSANPLLDAWLQAQPSVQDSPSALVIGCGLGDDAEALANAGYRVTAFDISQTAIAWVKQRFPDSSVTYEVGDLFHPKAQWQQQFELVFECRNFQALPVSARANGIKAIAQCIAPQGRFLMITNYRDTEEMPDGPPWPLAESELSHLIRNGLVEIKRDYVPSSQPGQSLKLRIEYRRP